MAIMLAEVVGYVCANYSRYKEEAEKTKEYMEATSAPVKTALLTEYLHKRVSEKFELSGHSLEQVIKDPTSLQKFVKIPLLDAVLRYEMVDYVCKHYDRYIKEAMETEELKLARSAPVIAALLTEYLHKRISEKLALLGHSLQDVIDDPILRQKFEKSARLNAVLRYHETSNPKHRDTSSSDSSKPSLEKVAAHISNKRVALWDRAVAAGGEDMHVVLMHFVNNVRAEFRRFGYSFSEMLDDRNSHIRNEYFTRSRLELALQISKKLLQEQQKQEASPEEMRERAFKEEAQRLAEAAYDKGEGLVTRLGMKEVDREKLGKAARRRMFEEHPDRAKDGGDRDRFDDAAALKRLIDQGQFDAYEDHLVKLRGDSASRGRS